MFESIFQSFEDQADASKGASRVAALRAELRRLGLDGFIIPRADRHQNEYVPASEERLAWLSGFTGSAGVAIVLRDRAAIFVDGRYTLAVRDQVDPSVFEPLGIGAPGPAKWLEANLRKGARFGYDPWLHTPGQVERLEEGAAERRRSADRRRAEPDRQACGPTGRRRRWARSACIRANMRARPRRKSSAGSRR